VYWAGFGLLCLLFQGWVFARWAIDGNAHAHHSGGYDIAPMMKTATHAAQAVAILAYLVLAVLCWRKSRALGRVHLYAAALVGYTFSFWSNPYSSTVHYAAGNNRYDLNVETWGPYLPGWQGQTPAIESLLMEMGYPLLFFWMMIAFAFARLFQRYRPNWSRARVAATTALAVMLCDPILIEIYLLLGGFAYPRALPAPFTLFEGQWYQFPLSSTLAVVLICVMPVVVMSLYAKKDREVVIFEGSLELPGRTQSVTRLLAGIGFINACVLVFQVAMLLASLISHPIDLPSWLDRPRT